MRMRYIAGVVALMVAWQSVDAKLWINEIMQSNIDGVYTAGDFPDSWFEIYNDGDETIRLVNYRVGDSDDFDKAYVFNATVGVGKNNYNVIYCDKVGSGYHTDFRIDSGKGKLYLFSPEGEIIDYVSFPKMLAPNVAYGRVTDGSDEWGYQLTPTPRTANTGGVSSTLLPEPVFSVKGNARYDVKRIEEVTVSIPQDVELPADTRLYVTTDGSEPTIDSPSYEKEFTISTQQTMVIRAKLISAEAHSPRSTTHSYISHPREVDLPIVSLNTNSEYMNDSEIGIWPNFEQDWRRPVHVEYFDESGKEGHINQLGEFRIHGGWSRNHVQKSLAIYANKRFGTKNYAHPFFPDKPEVKKSKSFVLRNGGNAFTDVRIKDSFVQTLFGRNCANLDWQAYCPVICYINGEYRGFYALRQRSNEDYVEDCYDGLEDIDMLENWEEVKAGDTKSFEELKALYNSNPTYEQMEQAIDVENFMNIYIANAWATNTDFPGNNIVMWRPTEDGGKWRWIMKDLDFLASHSANYNYFNFLLHTGSYSIGEGNASHAVKLFKVMTNLDEFRNPFLDRFFVYLGDFLRPSVTAALIDEQRDEIAPEYAAHLQCYGNPTDYNGWLNHVENLKQWCAERTEAMPRILCDYFGLGNPLTVSIDGGAAGVSINGVPLTEGVFEGVWPTGRALTVTSNNSTTIWTAILTSRTGRKNTYEVNSPEYVITPSSNIRAIRLEATQSSGVDNVKVDDGSQVKINVFGDAVVVEADEVIESIALIDLSGRKVASSMPMVASAQLECGHSGVYVVEIVLVNGERVVRKIML